MSIDLKLLTLPFPESEIEWRIGQAGKKGNGQIWATCLAYVQARAIMNRFDEVVGPGAWKVSYRLVPKAEGIDAGVIAQVAVKIGDEWVMKEDGAEQTDIESFKGGMSAALKRAGSVWGVGRYLYGLESGFAQIVEKGTQDAQWGKTKDGTDFYWVAPRLPQWALPSGHVAARPPANVRPGQPEVGDGDTNQFNPWTFTFGQWNKKTLEQVYNDPKYGPRKMADWCDWLIDENKKKGTQLTARAREAIEAIENFLGAMENATPKVGGSNG